MSDGGSSPFPHFNWCGIEVLEWLKFHLVANNECNHLSLLGFKLFYASKKGPNVVSKGPIPNNRYWHLSLGKIVKTTPIH